MQIYKFLFRAKPSSSFLMQKIKSCLLTVKPETNNETTANLRNVGPTIFPQHGATQSCTCLNLKCLESHWGGRWRAALALASACCTLRTFLFTWLNCHFQSKLPAHFSHFYQWVCMNRQFGAKTEATQSDSTEAQPAKISIVLIYVN